MEFSYKVLPQAEKDLIESLSWFEREAGSFVRDSFMADYILTRTKACTFPYLFSPFYGEFRKFRFSRFPFKLIYRIENNTVIIVAVAHDKRKPFYWSE